MAGGRKGGFLFGLAVTLITAAAGGAVLDLPAVRAVIDDGTGRIMEVMDPASGRQAAGVITDRYETETESAFASADESGDVAISLSQTAGVHTVTLICTNAAFPGLLIRKHYALDEGTRALVKQVSFSNTRATGFFIRYYTDAQAGTNLMDGFFTQSRKHHQLTARPAAMTDAIPLGREQTEIHRVLLVAPQHNLGVAHYRYRVDGQVQVYQTSNNFAQYAAWLPTGWRFSICAFYLNPGDSRDAETRVELFDGDMMAFHVRLRNRPEFGSAFYPTNVPEHVAGADVCAIGNHLEVDGNATVQPWYDYYIEQDLRSLWLSPRGWPLKLRWGDVACTGSYVHCSTGDPIALNSLYTLPRNARAALPKSHYGLYTLLWFVSELSRTYIDHRDYVVYRKDGTPDFEPTVEGLPRPEDCFLTPSYLNEVGAPGAIEHFAAGYGDMARVFELDMMYIDGALCAGESRLNWSLHRVTQPYEWRDLYHAIRNAVRDAVHAKLGHYGAMFVNADAFPIGDVNFWELGSWHNHRAGDWRAIALGLSWAKINAGADTMIVPMRWATWPGDPQRVDLHEPVYPNYLLAFGLLPFADNLALCQFKTRLPIIRACKETRGSVMVDAGISPAYWETDVLTPVEAYTLRLRNFGLIPVMGRQTADAQVQVAFDTQPLGLGTQDPVYLWVNAFVTPQHENITSAESLLCTEPVYPYPEVFLSRFLTNAAGPRVSFGMALPGAGARFALEEPGPLQLVVASPVPVWVYAAAGRRYHTALPGQDGVMITRIADNPRRIDLRVQTDMAGVELFVPDGLLPYPVQAVYLDGAAITPSADAWDGAPGLRFTVPAGQHDLTLSAGEADLGVSKTAQNSAPDEGETVVYVVVVTNAGPQTADSVLVEDPFPPGLSPAPPFLEPDPFTILRWSFEETSSHAGASIADAGPNGYDGTPYNDGCNGIFTETNDITVNLDAVGVQGSGIKFTMPAARYPPAVAQDRRRGTVIGGSTGGGDFTFEGWFSGIHNAELAGADPTYGRFLAMNSRWDWFLTLLANGGLRVRVGTNQVDTAALTWSSDAWYYVALTAEGIGGGNSRYTLYRRELAGTELEQVTQGTLPAAGNSGIFALGSGTSPGMPNRILDFRADEVSVSGVARSVDYLTTNSAPRTALVSQGFYRAGVWQVGSLPPGASATMSLRGRVGPGTRGHRIVNLATVTADLPDPDVADNQATATIAVGDTDWDGLPDLWETAYFGDPTNALAGDDEDGDGADNLSEFIAGTHPTNAASLFAIGGLEIGHDVRILFHSSTSRVYTLELVPDLLSGAWSNAPGPASRRGVGGPDIFTNSYGASSRYYRIRVALP